MPLFIEHVLVALEARGSIRITEAHLIEPQFVRFSENLPLDFERLDHIESRVWLVACALLMYPMKGSERRDLLE